MSLDTNPVNLPPLDPAKKALLLFAGGGAGGWGVEQPNTQASVSFQTSELRLRTTGEKEQRGPLNAQ